MKFDLTVFPDKKNEKKNEFHDFHNYSEFDHSIEESFNMCIDYSDYTEI